MKRPAPLPDVTEGSEWQFVQLHTPWPHPSCCFSPAQYAHDVAARGAHPCGGLSARNQPWRRQSKHSMAGPDGCDTLSPRRGREEVLPGKISGLRACDSAGGNPTQSLIPSPDQTKSPAIGTLNGKVWEVDVDPAVRQSPSSSGTTHISVKTQVSTRRIHNGSVTAAAAGSQQGQNKAMV